MDIIEGVRILTQENVLVRAHGGVVCTIFLILCSAIAIMAILNFVFTFSDYKKIDKLSIVVLAISVACIAFLVQDYSNPNEYRTQYMVEVSDEASFNEFYHKYKVIEDKGNDIYIVYEKE